MTFRNGIVAAAVVAYVIALGCVILPGQSPAKPAEQSNGAAAPARSTDDLPLRAIGMQIQRVDWMDKYKESIDEIAAVGADAVKLVVDARQENGSSARIYLDMRMTPTTDQLEDLIRHAKKRNLKVILMPIVLLDHPRGDEWRGIIEPVGEGGRSGWADWFDSYRAMIQHFSELAQRTGVDVLVIGSELVSAEPKVVEWQRTIDLVREIYKGKITYSSNWDHYTAVPFWNKLDLIGMNSYWKLDNGRKNLATLDDIKFRWSEIQADLLKFQKKIGKPILFLEVGWCSMANAAHQPWDYTKTENPVDFDLQKRLYEGFFESCYGNPALGGFSIWEWTPGDPADHDRGYTPEGKPAEKVLREWFAKPKWKVNP